jgi:hypothetical protein
MDAPAVVLVPPTPLKYVSRTSSPSSSPSSSSSYPAQSPRFSTTDQRASSETTIFSIYSMYGDDQPPGTSWSAPAVSDRKSKGASIGLSLPKNRYSSYHKPSGYPSSQLAYYETDAPNMTYENHLANKFGAPLSRTTLETRPSSYAPTTSFQLSIPEADNHRPATGHSFQTSSTSSVVIAPSRSSPNHSLHSRSSSRSSPIPYQGPAPPDLELPPLPPSQPSSLRPSPSPSPSLRRLSPTLQPPGTPSGTPSLPLKHPIAISGSPASKTSLVPSEGEDLDAFHVRNTYAQLETSGVKGDGFEEGVERTRARLGASRSSQLNAEAAIDDGTEKTRDLHPKEIETLRTVDRWVYLLLRSIKQIHEH